MRFPSLENAGRMLADGVQYFVKEVEELVQMIIDKLKELFEGII